MGADGWRAELLVIERVSHAYLHVSGMLPVARMAIEQSEVWLRQILEQHPEKCY